MANKSYRFNGFRTFGVDFYNWSSITSWSMDEEAYPENVQTFRRSNCGVEEQQLIFTGTLEEAEDFLEYLNSEGEKDYVQFGS